MCQLRDTSWFHWGKGRGESQHILNFSHECLPPSHRQLFWKEVQGSMKENNKKKKLQAEICKVKDGKERKKVVGTLKSLLTFYVSCCDKFLCKIIKSFQRFSRTFNETLLLCNDDKCRERKIVKISSFWRIKLTRQNWFSDVSFLVIFLYCVFNLKGFWNFDRFLRLRKDNGISKQGRFDVLLVRVVFIFN